MTDPTDETQPHETPNVIVPPPAAAAPGQVPLPAPPPPDTGAPPDTEPAPDPESPAITGSPPAGGASSPPLRADPNRPVSEWREPPWFPPRDRDRGRDRGPSLAAVIIGLIVLGIGVWYFLDHTLGVDMPALRWNSIWPLVLIVVGLLIVVRALSRR